MPHEGESRWVCALHEAGGNVETGRKGEVDGDNLEGWEGLACGGRMVTEGGTDEAAHRVDGHSKHEVISGRFICLAVPSDS